MKPSRRASVTSLLLSVVLTGCLALLSSSPASASLAAAKGVDVSGPVTDSGGVLGSSADGVRTATKDFYRSTGRKLFVVLVPTFGAAGGPQFIDDTIRTSHLGTTDVVLAIATDTRQVEITADPDDFSVADLTKVRTETIEPAVAEGQWAQAITEGADQLAESRSSDGVSWIWILAAVVVLLGLVAFGARRYRRSFERTHHVQDEHGRVVDPASILADDEIEDAADRALVSVDNALLTSFDEVANIEQDHGAPGQASVPAWRGELERLRGQLDTALARRAQLDSEPSATRRRATASALLTTCDQIDRALDELASQARDARSLRQRAPEVLAAVERRLDELTALPAETPDHLGQALEAAARAAIVRSRAADDAADRAADLRVAEAATNRLAVLPLIGSTAASQISTHRGAVGVLARALAAAGNDSGARDQADADLSTWSRPDDGGIEGLWALAQTGAVVEAPDQHRIGSVLGGSSHGSGTNTPFPGSERPDRYVAPGFGGHRSIDRRPTITRL